LLDAAGVSESQLPTVVQPGTLLGGLLPAAAEELGLPENVQVVIGTHDQIVNALGAGVAAIGDAVDTSGTCECITPLFPSIPETLDFQRDNFACVPYLEELGYVTYAYNISAGSVVRWCRDALASHLKEDGRSVYTVLNELAPAEPTSLMVLPFLQGMGGTPDVDPNATGLIAGLTTQTRLPDIYRAILEGVTFEMRYNMEKLSGGNVSINRLLACGGGARSPVWLQIKADILGCEIIPVQQEETGAMGSAILGLAAVTGESPLKLAERFWQYDRPITPNPEHMAVYTRRYELYKQLRAFYKEI
jgi:xylulokinase